MARGGKEETRKGNDEGEPEAEAPNKKNKHNQQKHRKIDQNHDKRLKYLLHKKIQSLTMIDRDLLSRREKARHIKQFSLSC